MKARKQTLSPFPRPQRTIVAIITDKGEQIDVASFRGIHDSSRVPGLPKSYASYFDTPQSIRLNVLRNYIDELALQWAAYEAGFDPHIATAMADALKEIKSKEVSETNSKNAGNSRNEFAKRANAKQVLLAFKDQFERVEGKTHGWRAKAYKAFLIDPATLKRILARKDAAKVD